MASKWDKFADFIRKNRDSMDSDEIAAAIGTTRNNLHKICLRQGIRLPRKNYKTSGSIKDRNFYRVSNHEGYTVASATAFLNSQGYRVILDPFLMPGKKGKTL